MKDLYNCTSDIWDKEWEDKFDHYQNDIRHALYIAAILSDEDRRIIELGAGSFRDVRTLNKMGIDCYGLDFSIESVTKARELNPEISSKILQADCFDLQIPSKSYDLSYHNGLWGYFNDNEISKLLKEQVRITKRKVIVTVHNQHNKNFVDYFNQLKVNDPLYDIRFFEVDEIRELMLKEVSSCEIIPVGKGKKLYEDDLINIGIGTPCNIRKSFDFHKMGLLDISERLMCVGYLR